jgi:uncharacterized RDD family membrane protein YckC
MYYAGIIRRLIAGIIDVMLILASAQIVYLIISIAGLTRNLTNGQTELVTDFLSFIIGWVYYAQMESSTYQATIGKQILQISVTRLDGERLSFARASARYFAKLLSTVTFFVGYLMAGFTEKKQALHDKIAKTVVVQR